MHKDHDWAWTSAISLRSLIGSPSFQGDEMSKALTNAPQPRSFVLGDDLRNLRKQKGLTIERLSQLSKLSTGVISQIERNKTAPSIRTLFALTSALDVPMGWLLEDTKEGEAEDASFIVRAGNRRKMHIADRGIRQEIMTPHFSGKLQMILVTIAPNGGSGRDGYSHEGEEAGFVVSGELELTVGQEMTVLRAGDSFKFQSDIPHSYSNPGAVDTSVVWVTTPPVW
jgi:transcriptional regulator with XRE-family HTH domain